MSIQREENRPNEDSSQKGEGVERTVTGRGVLDAVKRARVVALLANGSSRRVAARFVGCAPSTITRTAERDPEFARHAPGLYTAAKVMDLFAQALASLRPNLADAPRDDAMRKLGSLLLEFGGTPQANAQANTAEPQAGKDHG